MIAFVWLLLPASAPGPDVGKYNTVAELPAGQRLALLSWLGGSGLIVDLIAVLIAFFAAWLWRTAGIGSGAILLSGLALGYTASRLGPGFRTLVGIVVLLVLGACVVRLCRLGFARDPGSSATAAVSGFVAGAMAVVFVGACILFAKLAIPTERWIASGATPSGRWAYVSAIDLAEIRESYREYLQVSGFAGKKAALLGFLRSKGIDG